jgi:hypothetical protein
VEEGNLEVDSLILMISHTVNVLKAWVIYEGCSGKRNDHLESGFEDTAQPNFKRQLYIE